VSDDRNQKHRVEPEWNKVVSRPNLPLTSAQVLFYGSVRSALYSLHSTSVLTKAS